MIASRVSIVSGTKQHVRVDNKLIDGEYRQVVIGVNSWLGEGSIISANIGQNSNVALGAVVIKDSSDNITLIGNPAKEIAR